MKMAVFAALAFYHATGCAQAQTFSADDLNNRTIHRRAVEAVNWGMLAVNFDLLYQAVAQAKGSWNEVVYWSRLPDWKNQTLTPDPDVIYVFPFFDTKEVGPMVMEIPPAGPDGAAIARPRRSIRQPATSVSDEMVLRPGLRCRADASPGREVA
jgi:hypothetical protein